MPTTKENKYFKNNNLKSKRCLFVKKNKPNVRILELKRRIKKMLHFRCVNSAEFEFTAADLMTINNDLNEKNKELEIMKQELQKTIEQVSIVNHEMISRNDLMTLLNNDLSNLFATIDMPIIIVDSNANIRRFNAVAETLLNMASLDIGKPLHHLNFDSKSDDIKSLILNVIDKNTNKEIEIQNNHNTWFKLQIKPYLNINKKPEGAILTLVNIDILKKGALELKIVGDDANAIFESNSRPLVVIKHDKSVGRANVAFFDEFKIEPRTINTKVFNNLISSLFNDSLLFIQIEKTMESGVSFQNFELDCHFLNIGPKFLLVNARKVLLAGSLSNAALVSFENITLRKKIETDLKTSEEKYRNLVATSYNGIMVIRSDGTIEFANTRLETIFGYDEGELLNKNYEILITNTDRDAHLTYHQKYMQDPVQKKMGRELNLIGKRKDGSTFPIDVSLSPFRVNSDVYVNCLVNDITEQKIVEETQKRLLVQEKALRKEAIRNNLDKDEFLATLSHELRTPLTTILGWTQQLQNSNVNAETKEALAIIERSAKAQGQLVDDLLDVSRINAGKVSLDLHVINLIDVVSESISAAFILAQKKNIDLKAILPIEKLNILADTNRLQQIFWNLLTNAIKFTPYGGKISIKISTFEANKGKCAQVSVADNGMGIKADFINHLFERFSQVDSSMTRVYGGLGLGLAIVKSLVELHKGSITAESPGAGLGSTFIVTLPLVKNKLTNETVKSARPELPIRLNGIKALVVDDNVDNLFLFDVMLKSLGVIVKTTESAEKCLEIFQTFKPDILLSDISMPGEDGYSLIKKIRLLSAENGGQIPAIALTAYAAPEDVKLALAAGFSGHAAKPVDIKVLLQVIASQLKI